MNLFDVNHEWSSDLSVSNTGDLSLVSGVQRGQQRILRRLLTTPGDYYAQPNYGAGILAAIGSPQDQQTLIALITAQVLLEDSVAQSPPPVVTVNPVADPSSISLTITYTDQPSNAPTVLSFTAS